MLEVKSVNLKRVKVDTLVVPVCEDCGIHTDNIVKSLVDAANALTEFKGKQGDRVTLYKPAETRIARVVFFGLGKAESLTGESFRAFAGKAVKFCIDAGLRTMTLATPSASALTIDGRDTFKITDGRELSGQSHIRPV